LRKKNRFEFWLAGFRSLFRAGVGPHAPHEPRRAGFGVNFAVEFSGRLPGVPNDAIHLLRVTPISASVQTT